MRKNKPLTYSNYYNDNIVIFYFDSKNCTEENIDDFCEITDTFYDYVKDTLIIKKTVLDNNYVNIYKKGIVVVNMTNNVILSYSTEEDMMDENPDFYEK